MNALAARVRTVVALVIAAVATMADQAMAECNFAKRGEIPVTMKNGQPLVEVQINGKAATLVLDTGAVVTAVSAEASKALGLDPGPAEWRGYGLGGEHISRLGLARQFRVANFAADNTEMIVLPPGAFSEGDAVGLLGQSFFGKDDVEFDLAHGVVRLFRPQGCELFPLAYWGKTFSMADIEAIGSQSGPIQGPVTVNGKKLYAFYDTGSPITLLDIERAKSLGVPRDPPVGSKPGEVGGVGKGGVVRVWPTQIESFAIGDESISKVKLLVAETGANVPFEVYTGSRVQERVMEWPSLIIGADFFMAHRVYVAHSQRRMYFTYNGGPIFTTKVASAP